MAAKEWERQAKEMERILEVVEGVDDRTYGPPDDVKLSAKKVL